MPIMAAENIPRVSATLRLEPCAYSLSKPPTLHLEITSYHNSPITIFADDLSPEWMLRNGTALIIMDLAGDRVVEQVKRRPCRIPPPSSVSVPLIESKLYTLYPEQPLILAAPFFINPKKQNNSSERDIETDERQSDDQPFIPGHRYKVSLSGHRHLPWDSIRWWEHGTKEEVLRRGPDGREVRYGNSPHGTIAVDISRIHPIVFECTE
ncbi:hypothetical protein F4777DRAFT_567785 [Nemania sp. FL0916]|nr:hypothetical protein F4777DRAFT_567785 [Nemania sp. FL0916]